jgi:putative ABC transport system substrate-binding protein
LLFAFCVPAHAQQAKKIPAVGFLSEGFPSSVSDSTRIEAFRKGLHEIGYMEGKNISIDYRFAEGKRDRLPDLAAELVQLKVDVIVTYGTVGTLAVKRATTTIPIVMASSSDPVGRGLVASLARPGGNVTGLSSVAPDLSGKRLELLKEVIPKLTRVAVLWDSSGGQASANFKDTQVAARALRVQVQSLEVRSANDFEPVFKAATRDRVGSLIVLQSLLTNAHRQRIVELVATNRLPAMYTQAEYVNVGGLMSYAPSYNDIYRRAATYVDKILKGTKPADIPVEQPTKFDLIINLTTARALGLTVPPTLLARADEVIE